MAIAHFMGAQTLAALPLAARAPVLVFKADLQPQPEAVPSDSASPPTRSQAATRRLSGGGPGCYSPPVWRKPEARATLKLPFKFKFKLR